MKIHHTTFSIYVLPYKEKDRERFIDIFMDEELCEYMAGGAFDKRKDAENLFDHFLKLNLLNNKFNKNLGIYKNENLIGHFELLKNSFTKENEIEIVYLLIKEYWGKGIMKNIIQNFQKSYRDKLIARVQLNNFNSINMLEKIGIEKQTIAKFNNENVIKIILK